MVDVVMISNMYLTICAVLRAAIYTPKLSEYISLDKKHFTRNRTLTARVILAKLLCKCYGSIQAHAIITEMETGKPCYAKSSFSEAREYFDPEYLKDMFRQTVDVYFICEDLPKLLDEYIGVAIDGMKCNLNSSACNKEEFGWFGHKDATMGMLSLAVDVVSGIILAAQIDKSADDERKAALELIKQITERFKKNKKGRKLLFLFDRGYPDDDLVKELLKVNAYFVMRCKSNYHKDLKTIKRTGKITLKNGIKVRCVYFKLDSGKDEWLITNLSQKKFPYMTLKLLYSLRWHVEECNKVLKSRLNLENVSGRKPISVYQDMYATLIKHNVAASLALSAQAKIDINYNQMSWIELYDHFIDLELDMDLFYKTKEKEYIKARDEWNAKEAEKKANGEAPSPKKDAPRREKDFGSGTTNHRMKPNMSLTCALVSFCYMDMLMGKDNFDKVFNYIVKYPEQVRPGRMHKRKKPRCMRYYDTYKRIVA
ncbi:MAG: transposase [Puniceicoccales bacterium]|jgi:hypothetical protein|nr:transposase [Puniceicoccales bacterium]